MDDYSHAYIKAAYKIDQFAEGALDKDIKTVIKRKAIVGGVLAAIPLFGVETILYGFVLWSTYRKISEISSVPFKDHLIKNVLGGFVINIIVTFIILLILDSLFVIGWIGSFILGYISIYLSGMGYLKALKALHGGRSTRDVNFEKGLKAIRGNKPIDISDRNTAIINTERVINKQNSITDNVVSPQKNKAISTIMDMITEQKKKDGSIQMISPLPGIVIEVLVSVGQPIKRGDTILTIESMKMENSILAERDGIVTQIAVVAGQKVNQDDLLVVLG